MNTVACREGTNRYMYICLILTVWNISIFPDGRHFVDFPAIFHEKNRIVSDNYYVPGPLLSLPKMKTIYWRHLYISPLENNYRGDFTTRVLRDNVWP